MNCPAVRALFKVTTTSGSDFEPMSRFGRLLDKTRIGICVGVKNNEGRNSNKNNKHHTVDVHLTLTGT